MENNEAADNSSENRAENTGTEDSFGRPRIKKDISIIDGKGMQRRSMFKKRYCKFCKNEFNNINYKNIELLIKFTKSRGKIVPRRFTGNCAHHQRLVTNEIKRARYIALLPYICD